MIPRADRVASQLRGGGLPLLRLPPLEGEAVVDTIILIMEAAVGGAAVPSAEAVATTGPLVDPVTALPPILVPPAARAMARIASRRAAAARQFPGMAIAPARTPPSRSG